MSTTMTRDATQDGMTAERGVGSPGTASEVLLAAADLIAPPGAWTTGMYAKNSVGRGVDWNSPSAACWCVRGAIWHCARDWRLEAEAETLLRRTAGTEWLPEWNDDPRRTQAEVVAALREAATRDEQVRS